MSERCKEQESEMKILNNFYDERRQYEGRISSLEEEIASLKRELSAKTTNTKERENVVANMRTRLVGVNRSRDLVHSCLKEACQSIKVALAMKVSVNCCRIDSIFPCFRENTLVFTPLRLNSKSAILFHFSGGRGSEDEDEPARKYFAATFVVAKLCDGRKPFSRPANGCPRFAE